MRSDTPPPSLVVILLWASLISSSVSLLCSNQKRNYQASLFRFGHSIKMEREHFYTGKETPPDTTHHVSVSACSRLPFYSVFS